MWPEPTPDMDVARYLVEMKMEGSNTWRLVETVSMSGAKQAGFVTASGTAKMMSVTITGLSNGVRYWFRVMMVNTSGDVAEIATDPEPSTPRAPPFAPSNLTAVPGNAQVSLAWDAPSWDGGSPITGYTVYYSSTGTAGPWTLSAGALETRSHVVAGLTNGTAYWFKVTASNEAGEGAAVVTATSTKPATVPSAPTSLSVTPESERLVVKWSNPSSTGGSPVTGYRVYYSTDGGSGPWTLKAINLVERSYTITDLSNGTPYWVKVTASNAEGDSEPAIFPSAVTPRTTPDAPTDIATFSGNQAVVLTWAAPAWNGGNEITDYIVEYRESTNTEWTTFADVASVSTIAVISGLNNGTSYDFRIAAVNDAGVGTQSEIVSAIPRTTPGAPLNINATPDSEEVLVAWDAPESDGGSEISGYTVLYATSSGGPWTVSGSGLAGFEHTVTGLTNGTPYWFKIIATNVAGPGTPAVTASSTTPRTVPDAPTALTATPQNSQVTLDWTTPEWNGGNTVSDYTVQYRVSTDTEWLDFNDGVSQVPSAVVTGLENGTGYDFRVAAVNDAGQGAFSTSASAMPRTVPLPPLSLTTTPENEAVELSWATPEWDGGEPITGYTVYYATNQFGPWTEYSTGLTELNETVTGLANGTGYWFRVTATNIAGEGAPVITEATTTPRTVPDAPAAPSATPKSEEVLLSWSAPSWNGGNAISDYIVEYRASTDTEWTTLDDGVSAERAATVPGLENGTSYDFRIAAVNEAGTGAFSPLTTTTPRTTPDAPTGLAATPESEMVELQWVAPAWNGGNAIIGYSVYYSISEEGPWVEFASSVADTGIAVTNLANGTPYWFKVTATNEAGEGNPVISDSSTTPRTIPDAPRNLAVAPGSETADLTWQEPAFDGGNAISGYTVYYSASSTGPWTESASEITATDYTVTGLANGTAYWFKVTGTNEAGEGVPVISTSSTTPRTVPDAPSDVTGTPAESQEVAVTWSAPAWNGGNAISSYTIYYSTGSDTGPWLEGASKVTGLSHTVTGLENGTAYWFKVTAINEAGEGTGSVSAQMTTPRTVPDAPTGLIATPANTEVALSWEAPGWNGGNAISDYIVEYRTSPDGTWTVFADGTSTATTATVTGLENGTGYDFRVKAVNEAGTGSNSPAVPATPRTVPDAPLNLSAVPASQEAALSWNAPTWNGGNAITDYIIEYRTYPDGTWTVFDEAISSATSATVTGLANGTPYDFRVAAVNEAGTGAESVTATTTPRTVPDSAPDLTATPGNTEMGLAWNTPAWDGGNPIAYYVVEYRTSPTGTWTTLGGAQSLALNATVPGLENGTSYDFRVAAANEAGIGEYSVIVTATPRTIPDAPTGLTATPGSTEAVLSWEAPEWNGGNAISDYIVEYRTSPDGTWTVFADGTSSATSATVTGLENGTAYNFRVSAENAAGQGAYSLFATTTPRTVPNAPTGLIATPANTEVALSWEAPEWNGGNTISDYIVEYRTSPDGTWTVFADGTSSATSATVTGLQNGTEYNFRVSAANEAGTGGYSIIATATPRTIPDAPTGLTATPGNTEVALSWVAPAWNGGNAISDYIVEYRTSPDGTWTVFADGTSSATSATVTGLGNGTEYNFRVSAENAAGQGAYSLFATTIPRTTPDAPTGLLATPDNQEVGLSWEAPEWDGGNAISDYIVEYRTSPDGTWTIFADGVSTVTSVTVIGLTNGTEYDFRVAAANEAGAGAYSTAATATPRTVPDAPSNLTAEAAYEKVTLTWSMLWDGGNPVSEYTVEYRTSPDGEWVLATVTSGQPEATVEGLTNATAYDFRVAATNEAGTGAYSSPITATPRAVPDAPTGLVATPGNASAVLVWEAPAFDGGNAITDYAIEYRTSQSGTWTAFADGSSSATSATVTGLQNGTEYDFRVAAVNEAGAGAFSGIAATTPRTTPDAPANFTATPSDQEVSLSWNEPAWNGGNPVTDYVVEYRTSPSGTWTQAEETFGDTSLLVTGLTNGTAYDFRVKAVNEAGAGTAASATSTPRTVPDAPTSLVATPGNQQAALTWTAPSWNGGDAVSDYTIEFRTNPDGEWETFIDSASAATSATVTGLTNGTAYDFRVAAANAAGIGATSTSATTTPRTVPGAPTNLVATPGNLQVALTWGAPTSNGGNAISDYVVEYRTSPSGTWTAYNDGTSTSTGATVPALVNGTAYDFRVKAVNDAGPGEYSVIVTATPRTAPTAPRNLTVTGGNAQATLGWAAPLSDGGVAISGYKVYYSSSSSTGPWTLSQPNLVTGLTYTVTGLTNGTTYWFNVTAVNAAALEGPGVTSTSGVVPTAMPPTATITSVTSTTVGTITTNWSSLTGTLTSILVRACTNSGMTTGCVTNSTTTVTATTLNVTSVTANTLYYVRVETSNGPNTSLSATSTVTTAYNATYQAAWYTCPSGGTLSGTTCTTTSTYAATYNSAYYYCPSGGTLSGTTCLRTTVYGASFADGYYSCPSGGSVSGSQCVVSSSYPATPSYFSCSPGYLSGSTCYVNGFTTAQGQCSAIGDKSAVCASKVGVNYYATTWNYNSSGGYCEIYCERAYAATISGYSCPSGGSLFGSTCFTSSTYNATWNPGYYYCPSGGSLSGTTCTKNDNYSATYQAAFYSCPSGGSLSGSTCTVTSTYSATYNAPYYYCPSGGTVSGTVCIR